MAGAVEVKKVSKNARVGGSRTLHFIHECGGNINMIMVAANGKRRMEARCDRCSASARRPSFMDLFKEKIVYKHIDAQEA